MYTWNKLNKTQKTIPHYLIMLYYFILIEIRLI
jgi:hypothetical protein